MITATGNAFAWASMCARLAGLQSPMAMYREFFANLAFWMEGK